MTTRFHNPGREFERRLLKGDVTNPGQVTVGLYNQATDSLGKDAVLGDITTEPGSQPRDTLDLSAGTFSFDGNDGLLTLPSSEEIDVSTDTSDIDSYFILINYDGSDQLYATGSLVADESFSTYNLEQIDRFTVDSPVIRHQ